MRAKPLISVIVPVYNAEKYVCCCLDSIINQSYLPSTTDRATAAGTYVINTRKKIIELRWFIKRTEGFLPPETRRLI